LHPKYDIQGVDKIVDAAIKDLAMWLMDVQVQRVSNLEEM
jgi:hypothetical protein